MKGDKLQISGMNNSFLWDRPGLRTIEMVRMNCNDGQPDRASSASTADWGARTPARSPRALVSLKEGR